MQSRNEWMLPNLKGLKKINRFKKNFFSTKEVTKRVLNSESGE